MAFNVENVFIGVLVPCCACGITFAIPEVKEKALRASRDTFYCPNGHELSYRESTADKLTKDLAVERERLRRMGTRRHRGYQDAPRHQASRPMPPVPREGHRRGFGHHKGGGGASGRAPRQARREPDEAHAGRARRCRGVTVSRRSIPNGAVVACDITGCVEMFRSHSLVFVVREQAEAAGWTRAPQSQVIVGGRPLGIGRKLVDLCPAHKPRPRMEGAQP